MLNSKWTAIILTGVTLWLTVFAISSGIHRYGSGAELGKMETRIDDAKRENERLARELERMQQPQWLALVARQQLNYKQPEETVVFVYKSEKSGTIAQPKSLSKVQPNWKQWLEWLRGKKAGLPAEAP